MRTAELCAFIKKREAIRVRKEGGRPRPWTGDPILNTYRFCNVRRNDDRVTRELRDMKFMVGQQWKDEDAWFWWVVARLFNNTMTMKELNAANCVYEPFRPEVMRKTLKHLREGGFKIFNAAYIVSTNGIAMDKFDYIIDRVLAPLWKDRARLRPSKGDTLDVYHQTLCQYQGLGSFMAAQVVADLKYFEPLKSAADWAWWAASGPGSRRGLNRVLGHEAGRNFPEPSWRDCFHELWKSVNTRLGWDEPLTGQDLQNCLCEFDKYERARLGEGKPKQIYKERG